MTSFRPRLIQPIAWLAVDSTRSWTIGKCTLVGTNHWRARAAQEGVFRRLEREAFSQGLDQGLRREADEDEGGRWHIRHLTARCKCSHWDLSVQKLTEYHAARIRSLEPAFPLPGYLLAGNDTWSSRARTTYCIHALVMLRLLGKKLRTTYKYWKNDYKTDYILYIFCLLRRPFLAVVSHLVGSYRWNEGFFVIGEGHWCCPGMWKKVCFCV